MFWNCPSVKSKLKGHASLLSDCAGFDMRKKCDQSSAEEWERRWPSGSGGGIVENQFQLIFIVNLCWCHKSSQADQLQSRRSLKNQCFAFNDGSNTLSTYWEFKSSCSFYTYIYFVDTSSIFIHYIIDWVHYINIHLW